MKYLIVNADDFGATRGVTRGILEAHRQGIVTSTSLMVTTRWSAEAVSLAAEAPALSVGLHVDLTSGASGAAVDLDDIHECSAELTRQIDLFESLTGRAPTHLDSHHNAHRDPRVRGCFLKVAHERGLPLRGHSPARYFSAFYGQWAGEAHAEQISVSSLLGMLERDIGDGITELSCHPGYPDGELGSGYAAERELELETLCDPEIRRTLRDQRITLIGFRDLPRLAPVGVTETA